MYLLLTFIHFLKITLYITYSRFILELRFYSATNVAIFYNFSSNIGERSVLFRLHVRCSWCNKVETFCLTTFSNFSKLLKNFFFTLTYNPYDYKVSNEGCQGQKAVSNRQGYDCPHTMFTIVYFSRVCSH